MNNPSFENYYKSRQLGYIKKFANFFGIGRDAWHHVQFKKLVQAVIDMRESRGLQGRFVEVMTPGPETKFIIIGELHAAFHSLVRYLEALKKDAIIDEYFQYS